MATKDQTAIKDDTLQLKDIIAKITEYFWEVLRNWLLIGLFIIPFVLYSFYSAVTAPPNYMAKLNFMVNEDEAGGVGGAMAILSQFGLGGGGNAGKYNLDKIIDLSKSRRIIQESVFEKSIINDKEDYIANHMIDLYNIQEEEWSESDELRNFKFTHKDFDSFTRAENTALKAIRSLIVGGGKVRGIYSTEINEKTGIMALWVGSRNETLSIDWLNSLFKNMSQYYIDKSTEKQQATFNIVKLKVDSLERALDIANLNLAKYQDANRKVYSRVIGVKEDRLERHLRTLRIIYAEAVKNKEIAEFSLNNKTPFIQVIDEPIAPLYNINQAPLMAAIFGAILGGMLGVGFVIARRIYRDVMED